MFNEEKWWACSLRGKFLIMIILPNGILFWDGTTIRILAAWADYACFNLFWVIYPGSC